MNNLEMYFDIRKSMFQAQLVLYQPESVDDCN